MLKASAFEIAGWVQGSIANSNEFTPAELTSQSFTALADLSQAKLTEIAFFFAPRFKSELLSTQAGLIVTGEPFIAPIKNAALPLWKKAVFVVAKDPYLAMALLTERWAEQQTVQHSVHPTALVDPDAQLESPVSIGPYCVIESGVIIGAGSRIDAHSFIGKKSRIGRNSHIFSNVKIYDQTAIGDRARIHSGAVIGADGFGYAPKTVDSQVVSHQKIYHLGRVVIGNDVEIGANSCVDRGTFSDTVIGDFVKIDNLCQIGHNCSLGKGTVICGKVGFAGSSSTGVFVYVGGGSGINNQVHIGDHARIGGWTLVTSDVKPGTELLGIPGRNPKEYFVTQKILRRLVRRHAEKSKDAGKDAGTI